MDDGIREIAGIVCRRAGSDTTQRLTIRETTNGQSIVIDRPDYHAVLTRDEAHHMALALYRFVDRIDARAANPA